jgi:hypothetical protein
MCVNADREWDVVTDELVDLQWQLSNKVQAFTAKQVGCDSVAQHASYDIKDDAVPLLLDDATAKEMVKLKREITAKHALNKSM